MSIIILSLLYGIDSRFKSHLDHIKKKSFYNQRVPELKRMRHCYDINQPIIATSGKEAFRENKEFEAILPLHFLKNTNKFQVTKKPEQISRLK